MSVERVTYLDSSALVKLVIREPESSALLPFLRRRQVLVSSALARTEVARAVLALGAGAAQRCQDVLGRIELVRVSDRVLAAAGVLLPLDIRSLDAIHLATASLFGSALRQLVTYDVRMAAAARGQGITVAAPE